jgi:HEPN domain-containing protein
MKKLTDFKVWVELAEQHFALAAMARQSEKPLQFGICYHSHRCTSVYFKATLVKFGREAPGTHDLLFLKNMCSEAKIDIDFDDRLLDALTDNGTRVHNPTTNISERELGDTFQIASSFRRLARNLLGLE